VSDERKSRAVAPTLAVAVVVAALGLGYALRGRNKSDEAPAPTSATLGRTSHGAIGTKVFDYDGDGRLDLFVVDMHSDMWMGLDRNQGSFGDATRTQHRRFLSPMGPTVNEDSAGFREAAKSIAAKQGENYDELLFGNALYRNLGNGKFTENAVAAGLETFWPSGMATGDYDNDGHEDVFITAGTSNSD